MPAFFIFCNCFDNITLRHSEGVKRLRDLAKRSSGWIPPPFGRRNDAERDVCWKCDIVELISMNETGRSYLFSQDRWIVLAAVIWAAAWGVVSLGASGWIPRLECLLELGVLVFGFSLCGAALGSFFYRLHQRKFPGGALLSVLIIVLSVVGFRKIPHKPTQICYVPSSSITVRFYYHDSIGGATVSDSVSVTYQDGETPETLIFSAYSSPIITSINCNENAIILNQLHDAPIVLPLSWVQTALLREPLRFYKGKLETMAYADDVRDWKSVFVPTVTPTAP